MVINREQFLELVNLAKEKQLILEEAYTPFHMPVMNKIKEAIDAGKIGKVCEVQANFSAAIKNPNPKGRLYNPALGGGNLLDMGCYPICFAQLFMSVTNLKIKSDVQWDQLELILPHKFCSKMISSSSRVYRRHFVI